MSNVSRKSSGFDVSALHRNIMLPGKSPKVVFEVIDSGVGIKTKDQHQLFKMFGQIKSTQQMNTNGIGLGLFICKSIANEFGGLIGVKSEINQGSTFFFSFDVLSFQETSKFESSQNVIRHKTDFDSQFDLNSENNF